MITVRTTAFDKAELGSGSASVEEVEATSGESELSLNTRLRRPSSASLPEYHGASELIASASTKYLSEELTVSSRPDLSSAGRVVSGGRALKSLENFTKVLDPLADSLNAGKS